MASARLLAATVGTAITLSLLIGIGNALCGDSPPADSSGGGEQVFERLAPLSRIIWSPDRKNLVLVLTDASIWFVRTADPKNAKRLSGPVRSLGDVLWSPDGRWLLVQGERRGDNTPVDYPWGTLWLVDPEGKSPWKDLLPPGSPFQTPGSRWIQQADWLDDTYVHFAMHCGTGCVGHYRIDVKDGSYTIFCIGSGRFAWSPDRKVAVVENRGSGLDPAGLGLVEAASATNMAAGATPFQHDRACKSVFSGGPRTDDPGEFPRFALWLPDSRHVLYSDLRDNSLHVWDTKTGQRTTLIPSQDSLGF